MEIEFADEVYIFVEEGGDGIKFYDRSPSKAEQKFAGQLPDGVFHTDRHSISSATWDKEINEPNATKIVRVKMINYPDGNHNVTTYIVSAEQYQKILQEIFKAKQENRDTIVIDTREVEKEKSENKAKSEMTADGKIPLKDIAELDKENQINSSEIYDANKHLYYHKEYENQIPEQE